MEIEKVLKKTGYTSIITSIILGILGFIMFIYSKTTLKIIYICNSRNVNISRNYKSNRVSKRQK